MNSAISPKPENLALLVKFVRGEKVLLDSDLAVLYGVPTKALNQAVRRNPGRFPEDFMFRVTDQEAAALKCQNGITNPSGSEHAPSQSVIPSALKSQSVTSNDARGGRRHLPYVFTEQGVAMLSSVLRSTRAVEVNIAIMRTFVQLRRLMDSNRDLARKIESMEQKYDEQFGVVFEAIKQLVAEDNARKAQPPRHIGFNN